MIVVEKALADIFWQSGQWHAIVIIAGAMIRKRTAPQRQPASQGKDGCFIRVSRRCYGAHGGGDR